MFKYLGHVWPISGQMETTDDNRSVSHAHEDPTFRRRQSFESHVYMTLGRPIGSRYHGNVAGLGERTCWRHVVSAPPTMRPVIVTDKLTTSVAHSIQRLDLVVDGCIRASYDQTPDLSTKNSQGTSAGVAKQRL